MNSQFKHIVKHLVSELVAVCAVSPDGEEFSVQLDRAHFDRLIQKLISMDFRKVEGRLSNPRQSVWETSAHCVYIIGDMVKIYPYIFTR